MVFLVVYIQHKLSLNLGLRINISSNEINTKQKRIVFKLFGVQYLYDALKISLETRNFIIIVNKIFKGESPNDTQMNKYAFKIYLSIKRGQDIGKKDNLKISLYY